MVSRYEKAVFIIGSTATGKTKLGIDLALHLNGEIISSDSMQLYEKASLMTAKPTLEEQAMVKHHLIDFLPISTTSFTVRDYQKLALEAVQDIQSRGKIPIFVGGTMYYVESVLYDRNFTPGEVASEDSDPSEMIQKLTEFDAEAAEKIDKNNLRRVKNAYNYMKKTGKKPSQAKFVNKLRFGESYLIWLYCDTKVLEKRVKGRIDKMILEGGLVEIQDIMQNSHNDYTKGVLQSIGYKEFEPYLKSQDSQTLEKCISELVLSTVQYSKRQIRWIKNRMQPYFHINLINTNNADEWERIKEQAFAALKSPVNVSEVLLASIEAKSCEVCGVKLLGQSEFNQHIRSKKHKKKMNEQVIEDDEILRFCETCQREITGKINWVGHLKSKNHVKKARKRVMNE